MTGASPGMAAMAGVAGSPLHLVFQYLEMSSFTWELNPKRTEPKAGKCLKACCSEFTMPLLLHSIGPD